MKEKLFIILGLLIGLGLTFYIIHISSSKTINEINLEGKDTFWKATLNVNFSHDSELNIRPRRDDFNISSEIDINIIINDESVYNNELEYIEDPQGSLLGKYTVSINSSNYFDKGIEEVYLIIKHNSEISTIILKKSSGE